MDRKARRFMESRRNGTMHNHNASGETPMLDPDRYFSPVFAVREVARALDHRVADRPLVCPHGHVDPKMLADQRAVPRSGDAAGHPRSLRHRGCSTRRACGWSSSASRRATARRSRPIRANLAALRRPLLPVSRHADRRVADARVRRRLRHHRARSTARNAMAHLRSRSRSSWRSRSSGRERCSSGSTSRCSAPRTPRATRLEHHQTHSRVEMAGATSVPRSGPTGVTSCHLAWQDEIDRLGARQRAE